MASSFHWTDPNLSLPEFYRILKSNTFLTIIWNPRNIKNSKLHVEIEDFHKTVVAFLLTGRLLTGAGESDAGLSSCEYMLGLLTQQVLTWGFAWGFWSAHDAIVARGAMSIPGGGLSTRARLDLIKDSRPPILLCTPTYALRLAEVAAANDIDLRASSVTRIIVAGEPGGSIPSIRTRIEKAWDAKLIDHAGASEIGPWGFGDANQTGLHICEAEFIAEVIDPESGNAIQPGETGELVLTCLGRPGSPLLRYRTGDRVLPTNADGSNFVLLKGGVLSLIHI